MLSWTQISILIIFNYVILTRRWYDLNSYFSYSLRTSVCDWLDILSTYAMLCIYNKYHNCLVSQQTYFIYG